MNLMQLSDIQLLTVVGERDPDETWNLCEPSDTRAFHCIWHGDQLAEGDDTCSALRAKLQAVRLGIQLAQANA